MAAKWAALVVILLSIFWAWNYAVTPVAWRYRMTVTVETPEGLKTGSTVREVRVTRSWQLTPEMLPDVKLKGEAVVVDLGKRGVLFALMRGGRLGQDYGSDLPGYIFMPEGGQFGPDGLEKMSRLNAGPITLPVKWYPMFVRFKDLNDPKTIEAVSPYNDRDIPNGYGGVAVSLDKAFGPGVLLKSVEIEMTSLATTTTIEKYLPWISEINGYLSGNHISGRKLYEEIHSGDFSRN